MTAAMMSPYKAYLLQLKFEYRSVVGCDPRLAVMHMPCVWWGQYKALRHYEWPIDQLAVGKRTEFVLDGFQGSGNSFATAVFQLNQTRPVVIAHHMHSPAQIIKAVRAGIPTVLTVREPCGAVLSLISRWPYVSIPQALRGYVRFYDKVAPYADGYVVSLFHQTTGQFGEVIQRVNRKFGASFEVFDYDEAQMLNRKFNVSKRREFKSAKAEELQHYWYRQMLSRAENVYRRLERYAMDES